MQLSALPDNPFVRLVKKNQLLLENSHDTVSRLIRDHRWSWFSCVVMRFCKQYAWRNMLKNQFYVIAIKHNICLARKSPMERS